MTTAEKEKVKSGTDLFDQAMKNYETAFKAGLKLQEDAAKWWTGLWAKGPTVDVWQKKATGLVDEAMPALQKQLDESLKVVEQCSRSSLDLFKKGMEATRSTSVPEGQAKLQQLWESSLQTLQSNVQTVAQLNTKLVESAMEMARKAAEVAEPVGR